MAGRAILLLIVAPLLIGGFLYCIVRLQLFLSRTHSRWPGLILPGLALLPSLVMLFSILAFQNPTTTFIREDITDTNTTHQVIVHHMQDHGNIRFEGSLFVAIPLFLLTNIPTVILLAIYAICRDKMQKQAEMNRMNVQDL